MGLVFSRFTIPRNLGFSEPRKTHFSNSYQIIIRSNTSILLIKEYYGQSIILTIQYLLILGNGAVVGECKIETNKIGKNFNVRQTRNLAMFDTSSYTRSSNYGLIVRYYFGISNTIEINLSAFLNKLANISEIIATLNIKYQFSCLLLILSC